MVVRCDVFVELCGKLRLPILQTLIKKIGNLLELGDFLMSHRVLLHCIKISVCEILKCCADCGCDLIIRGLDVALTLVSGLDSGALIHLLAATSTCARRFLDSISGSQASSTATATAATSAAGAAGRTGVITVVVAHDAIR